MAAVQPAKVVNNVFGIGILPSGGDIRFVLISHMISSYAVGLPVAALTAGALRWGAVSVFGSRALEELLKSVVLLAIPNPVLATKVEHLRSCLRYFRSLG